MTRPSESLYHHSTPTRLKNIYASRNFDFHHYVIRLAYRVCAVNDHGKGPYYYPPSHMYGVVAAQRDLLAAGLSEYTGKYCNACTLHLDVFS